jgi:hypothetical protein
MNEKQNCIENAFVRYLRRFSGRTITVFVAAGGESGMGFTGVALGANKQILRLVTRIGTPPECALGNDCTWDQHRRLPNYRSQQNKDQQLGSITDIPIDKIVAIVHNII